MYVWPLTDRPDSTFRVDAELRLSLPGEDDPDPERSVVRILALRPYRRGFLVLFEGYGDRSSAELLRDRYLLRPFAETEPLDEGEIFYHQLLGLRVVTVDGAEVGRVREVYELSPTDILDVRGDGREHLIPFGKEVVVRWSLEAGEIVIDPPKGLLDL